VAQFGVVIRRLSRSLLFRSDSAQACLGQVEIALNSAQDFIVDHILIAQLNDRPSLNSKSFLLQAFI
jgi:hypothetical protein